jgi:hypothetical protein
VPIAAYFREFAMLYDISPAITERLKVWPGDTPPTRW